MKFLGRILFFFAGMVLINAAEKTGEGQTHPLVWDAMEKTFEAKSGESEAHFVFKVTNESDQPVTILMVRPSCGCTVVEPPADPWVLGPGASGALPATVDITGKDGTLTKFLTIGSTAGQQTLLMHIKAPPMDENVRETNQQASRADRQAVFRGSCVQCHVIPAMGKTGEDLFRAACLICHTPEGRASMVPSLLEARSHRDAAWWRTWISDGKEGTLMPAFGKPRGILTEAEIDSLVEFALAHLPTEPKPN
jgi:mono/diheme cytochrome c family protein